MSASKVLVCGSVHGRFKSFFQKVDAINKSNNGPFDLLICVGEFFGNQPAISEEGGPSDLELLLKGAITSSLETYFLGGELEFPEAASDHLKKNQDQLSENIFFLGRRGLYTTVKGLTVAYLSGAYHPQVFQLGPDDDDAVILKPKRTKMVTNGEDKSSESLEESAGPSDKQPAQPASKSPIFYRKDDVEQLLSMASPQANKKAFVGVDVLVTHEWPANILRNATTPPSGLQSQGREIVAQIAAKLKPRYHFAVDPIASVHLPRSNHAQQHGVGFSNNAGTAAALGQASGKRCVFYEREPYRNEPGGSETEDVHVTRFFGLADVHNTEKMRPFYAMSLVPMKFVDSAVLMVHPANTTEFPFRNVLPGGLRDPRKRGMPIDNFDRNAKRKAPGPPPDSYVCHICKVQGHWIEECPQKAQQQMDRMQHQQSRQQDYQVRRQREALKRSIHDGVPGLPPIPSSRGPRQDRNDPANAGNGVRPPQRRVLPPVNNPQECWFCLMNPHVEKHLIVSISDTCYLALAKGPLLSDHVLIITVDHYRHTGMVEPEILEDIENTYKKALKGYFDAKKRSYIHFEVFMRPAHLHIQVIPIPTPALEPIFQEFLKQGKLAGLEFVEGAVPKDFGEDVKFFAFGTSDGRQYYSPIKGKFSIQFGRELLARQLGIAEKADWKACKQTEEEEKEAATSFKIDFRPFDFTV